MIEIQVKSKSGHITQLQIEELISVDGKPYRGSAEDVRDTLIYMQGEINAIKDILGMRGADNGGD